MPSQLISSTGCCQPCDSDPIVVNTPGPQGAAGTNGTNGANGENAFSYTTASFIVPAFGASVVVPVANTSFLPESVAGQFFVSVQGCGYLQVTSVDGLLVTLQNPLAGVLGVPNAIPTTVIPLGSLITLAGALGATGAAGAAGGASSAATYIVRTPDASVPSATALNSFSSGYLKTQGSSGSGFLSTVATVPVGDISGVLPVANGGTNVATVPTNGQLLIGNGTGYTLASLTAGSNITITPGAGTISIASTASGAAFNYVTFTRRVDSGTLPIVLASPVNQNIFSSTNYPSTNYTGIDTASGFNSVNGRFVVPYSGYYSLNAVFIFIANSTCSANAAIRKNGSSTLLPITEPATPSGLAIGPFFLQYIDQAIAGDYYELVVTATGNGGTVQVSSSFSIQRIQA
jgi:hypothetical protein